MVEELTDCRRKHGAFQKMELQDYNDQDVSSSEEKLRSSRQKVNSMVYNDQEVFIYCSDTHNPHML
jgi:hypothetical protein